MGLLDSLRAYFGSDHSTPLVDYPENFDRVHTNNLEVRTAHLNPDTEEKIVIITMSEAVFERLGHIQAPLRITPESGRAVTFIPLEDDADPALDPKLGWIIPITSDTAAELRALPPGRGAHQLHSVHLGIIVEPD